MKVDLKEAAQRLGFSEQALLETSRVLLDASANGRNVYSKVPQACDYIMPEGMERGSPEHGTYLMFMTILDVQINSDNLHEKARELWKNNPNFYNAQKLFDEDKNKLYIKEIKPRSKKESEFAPVPESAFSGGVEITPEIEAACAAYFDDSANGNDVKKKRKNMKILVAPTISKILKKDLGCGFADQLSNRIYQTSRKLAMRHNNDPHDILKYVKDYPVALSRLDVFRPKPDIHYESRNETPPRFAGLGPAKTAPLLLHKLKREGFAKDLDASQLPVPMDRWEINCSIKRGIVDIGEAEFRKDKLIDELQALYYDTFKRNNISSIDFHEALWRLGSEACLYNSCKTKTNEKNESLCPFIGKGENPCKKFLDIDEYRTRGIIKASKFKME
jgi:hypothetical protein